MSQPLIEAKAETNIPQEKPSTPIPSIEQKVSDVPKDATIKPIEPKEDEHFKAFREGRKKDRQELEAAQKRMKEKEAEALALKAAMEAILNKSPQGNFTHVTSSTQYSEHPEEETEDQRIEKKVQAALEARESIREKERKERERQEYPYRLQQQYPDFQQIISSDNLDYLEYHYPEVARALQRGEDGFDKWEDIYKTVKKFVPNTNHKKDANKAENNFNKPKSIATSDVSPTGDVLTPHRLSEQKKAENWKRMQRTLNKIE